MTEQNPVFKSGFVALIGKPNVGKSTLLNFLVGDKVSIVSPKPQTTRSKILGILTDEHSQVVFVDTPGLHKPRTRLGEYMERTAQEATKAIDLICMLVDATKVQPADHEIARNLSKDQAPRYLLINKLDLVHPQEILPVISAFSEYGFEEIIPISARTGEGCDRLLQLIKKRLPEGPLYYPKDMWTDQTERQMASEIIREKALRNLREEIPHGIGVEILSFKTIERKGGDDLTEIHATVYCDREGHKRIIIGQRGQMLQLIGSQARKSLELLLGTQVNLQLWIKVRPNWRDSANDLRTLGYTDD